MVCNRSADSAYSLAIWLSGPWCMLACGNAYQWPDLRTAKRADDLRIFDDIGPLWPQVSPVEERTRDILVEVPANEPRARGDPTTLGDRRNLEDADTLLHSRDVLNGGCHHGRAGFSRPAHGSLTRRGARSSRLHHLLLHGRR